MVQYYAFPAPFEDLFEDLDFEGIRKYALPFALLKCAGTKFEYGMTNADVKKKVLARWLKEYKESGGFPFTEGEMASILNKSEHSYVIFADTARMLLALKKSYLDIEGDNTQLHAYYNMLQCMRADGTYVQILTDGRKTWEQHSSQVFQRQAINVDKDHMIYDRLTGKTAKAQHG